MKELLIEMIKAIVDKPDEVDISLTESENTVIYELRLGDGDVGKVIGKKGRNVTAIRTLLSAATAKAGGNSPTQPASQAARAPARASTLAGSRS